MIIGFDGSRAFNTQKTGTENYSYQLLIHLSKIDKKNQYIIYTKSFINEAATKLMKFPGNFKVMEIPWLRFWTQGGLSIQTFKDKIDVLFVPAHTLPLIKKPGLKTVVTVHDLGVEYLPKMHQLKQRLYLKWITNYQLKTATKLIAVSKATKDDLIKKIGYDPKKIEVIYEGYDKILFKPVKDDLLVNRLRQYELVAGNYFLFVGTVQPRKNLERLIRAFAMFLEVTRQGTKNRSRDQVARLRFVSRQKVTDDINFSVRSTAPHFLITPDFVTSFSLVIAGSKGWLSDQIYQLPKRLGIEDKVKFLGYVPDKDLPALYSGAIALVFPSLFEGFGLPILEAQACGCPVITSNLSSMPEVAGKGAILVNPYEIDDIVRGMERLQGEGYRLQLIKRGFENVKKFSWEKCARETLKVLEGVDGIL